MPLFSPYLKQKAGVVLSSDITGTANQIVVTDDGDDTVTLSTPQDIHTAASNFTVAGATVTGASVVGLNSAVFQPTTDSTTFFQMLDAAGASVLRVDTVNKSVLINTTGMSGPSRALEVNGHVLLPNGPSGGIVTLDNVGNQITIFQMAANNNLDVRSSTSTGNFTLGLSNLSAIGKTIFQAGGIDVLTMPSTTLFCGLHEVNPETLLELTHATPYVTLHNSTHEDSDGGRESRLIFNGEQSGGEETALFRFEASHDGAADDQLGKGVLSVNTGAGLAEGLRIDSNADVDVVNNFTAGTIQADDGFTGTGAYTNFTIVGGVITAAS